MAVIPNGSGHGADIAFLAFSKRCVLIRGPYDKSQMMEERRDFMVAWSDALVEQGLIT